MSETKAWLRDNQTLIYFLIAQFIAIGAGAASVLAYMVKLEIRVHTMETRGAEYTVARIGKLEERIANVEHALQNRIIALEQRVKTNEESINRMVDVMTRELHISPSKTKRP